MPLLLYCPCSELIRKFIGLKQRHEKVYRLYKYQEKLIADLEEVCVRGGVLVCGCGPSRPC